ncbi:MAG: DUF3383 family protein [Oscillospiraceae bacterium]|nr:DUF3383 family protein [Oscillospiraceae bacterium]
MSKNYDLIATVDIDLKSPIVDESSFDNLLLVGPLPQVAPDTAPPLVGEYSSMDEVLAAGWVVSGNNPDPVGLAAQVAFGQSPRPTKIYIAPIQASGDGVETAVETIKRAIDNDGWYVVCTAGVDSAQYGDIAEYIETQEKMFCYTEMDCFSTTEGGEVQCTPTVTGEYFRTLWIYGRESSSQADGDIPVQNQYMNVAFVAKWLQYDSGSETAAFKMLAKVSPAKLSTTETAVLSKKNGNYFFTIGNKNVTLGGTVIAGEWADIIRFRDWQKNDMQVSVGNLFMTVPKVPYTDAGIALVQNQMVASLKRGQDRGGIAEEEFDLDGNTIPGYTTSVPVSAAISATEKASRQLRNLKFKARLAGAIHFAELVGSLTYEM